MDPFEEKHKMMGQLLDMLKRHASDEVDSGLAKPEGEGDMHGLEIEKVEVLPNHEMDEATPEHEVDTKLVPESKSTANAGYDKGGVVPEDGQPDAEGAAKEEASESDAEREDEGDIEPMFTSLFGKKRKK
jgi:hypothetical protein